VPQSDDSAFSIKESELKAHLKSELNKINPTSEGNKTEAKDDKNIITQKKVDEDIQLKTAIDTIKILKIKQQ
jgi:carboxy--processing protease (C-terminal-processing protease)